MIRELEEDGKGIDKATFLTGMLLELGLVDVDRDIKPWIKKFEELDKSGDGVLNVEDVVLQLQREEEQRVNHLLEALHTQQEATKVMDVLGNITDFLHITHHAAAEQHHQEQQGGGGGGGGGDGRNRQASQVPVTKNPMRSQV